MDEPSYREESEEQRADVLEIARRPGQARQTALHRHVGEDAPVDQQQLHAYSSSSACHVVSVASMQLGRILDFSEEVN